MNISSAGSSIYSLQNVYKNYRNAGEKGKSAESSEKKQEQEVQREAAKLQHIEREVIAHEQAHMSAGAHLAGSANPSPQDLAVASRASMKQIQARGELSKSQSQAYQAGSNLGKELDMGKILDISM